MGDYPHLYDAEDLEGVIQMFLEYRDVHGRDEETAVHAAVNEYMEGYEAGVQIADDEDPVYRQASAMPRGEAIQRKVADLEAENARLRDLVKDGMSKSKEKQAAMRTAVHYLLRNDPKFAARTLIAALLGDAPDESGGA